MDQKDKEYLLELARASIAARLGGGDIPSDPAERADLLAPCGAFVTLKCGGRLRGCIGNIRSTRPLFETVKDMAVSAATQDPRFPPMALQELEMAHIEISVLTPMERVENPEEIQPGTHGLYIKKGTRSGLLLPQVATEWDWDREQFLNQTCVKAGLPKQAWKEPDTEIYRFSAEVFSEPDNPDS